MISKKELQKRLTILQKIEEFIESCKYQPLSTRKIVVDKEEISEYLRELRLKTPDEIKRYQKIISNKDAILEDAQAKADVVTTFPPRPFESRQTRKSCCDGGSVASSTFSS